MARPISRPWRFPDLDDEDLAYVADGVVPDRVKYAAQLELAARQRAEREKERFTEEES